MAIVVMPQLYETLHHNDSEEPVDLDGINEISRFPGKLIKQFDVFALEFIDNCVLPAAPTLKIDHLASFAAKRKQVRILSGIGDEFFFADGTGLCFDHQMPLAVRT